MRTSEAGWRGLTVAVLTVTVAAIAVPVFLDTAGQGASWWLAAGFAFHAIAASCLLLGLRRAASWLALPMVLAGLAVLAGHLLAYNGVSETATHWGLYLLASSRLHMEAGLALLAAGFATVVLARWPDHEFAAEIPAAAILLILVIVPVLLLGQRYGILSLDAGHLANPLRPPEAMVLVGIAVLLAVLLARHLADAGVQRFDIRRRFLPVTAFALLVAASFHLWLVLAGQDQYNMRLQSQATADRLQSSLTEHLADRVTSIEHFALRMGHAGDAMDRASWQADAETYLRDYESISAIGWVSADEVLQWAVARDELNYQEGERYGVDAMRQEMLSRTRQTGRMAFSEPLALSSGGYGQLVAIPVTDGARFLGWLVAGLRYGVLFTRQVAHVAPQFAVRIVSERVPIYARVTETKPHPLAWTVERDVGIDNLEWQIQIWPERAFFTRYSLWLPGLLLSFGLLAAVLFAFSLYQLEAQRRHTARLRDSEERYRLVAEQTGEIVYDYDVASGRIEWAGAVAEVMRMPLEEMNAGVDIDGWIERLHPDDAPAVLEELERAQQNLERFACEYRLKRADGAYARIEERGVFLPGVDGKAARMLGTISDVSQRHQFQEQLRRLAHFDQQTGLHNRVWFMEDAVRETESALERGDTVWFVFMDVDRFKAVNETLGHVVGDLLLEAVARRLEALVGDRGLLARLGGDEFGLCIHRPDFDRASMHAFCEALIQEFAAPFNAGGHSLFATLSVGIAGYPADGRDTQQVIRAAETAMFRAKQRGKNTYTFYEAAMSAGARENLEIANALRVALNNNEFHLVFQPRVGLGSGRITGMEALLRWTSPARGPVPPSVFIPVAEETGLIGPIGWYVVEAAAVAALRLGKERMLGRRMAINVSARQLAEADFVPELVRRVHEAGAMAHWFEIEITESVLMADPEYTRELLALLHEAGFTISIDDFGTGYSSLSYLKHFPADNLKIDRSFVMGLPESAEDAAIVHTIIRMGQGLGLRLVAEGIETEAQNAFLRDAGCQEAQGFLFARPMSLEELLGRLD